MVAIARLSKNAAPVSLNHVAATTHLPKRYLEHLMRDLKKASLLHAVSGRAGGYFLTRSPEKIRIGQIIQAAIGQINIVDCVREPGKCIKADVCECRLIYMLINHRITQVLNEFSLADLEDKDLHKKVERELSAY